MLKQRFQTRLRYNTVVKRNDDTVQQTRLLKLLYEKKELSIQKDTYLLRKQ
jgi:hypothetical protein